MKKPIKILFDANALATNNKSGIGFYTYHLIEALARYYPDDIELVGHYFNFLGRKKAFGLPEAPNIRYVTSLLIPGKVLNLLRRFGWQLPVELLFKTRGDVIIFPNYGYLPALTKIPVVTIIHDLAFVDHPDFVSQKNRNYLLRFVPKSLKAAKAIITVSQFSKSRITENFAPRAPLLVTPVPPPENSLPDMKGQLQITGKFLLFIGNIEPRKNIHGLIHAYMALDRASRQNYSLVLAGSVGWYTEDELGTIKKLANAGEKIILTGYVTENQKSWLYKNASLLLFISHYEGFGMPILEAMQHNVPLLLSNIPVFREIAGEAAFYCDQNDPGAVANQIAHVISHKNEAERKIDMYRSILKSYSWKQNATSLVELIKSIIPTH